MKYRKYLDSFWMLYNFTKGEWTIHTLWKVQLYNHLSFSNKLLKVELKTEQVLNKSA